MNGYETSVKIFLLKVEKPDRIEYITTDNQVGDDDTPYYNRSCATHFILYRDQPYMAIISSFNVGDPIPGVFTIKANVPIKYKVLDPL